MEQLREWSWLLAPIAMLYTWMTTGSRANSDRLIKVEDLAADQAIVLVKISAELEHMPTSAMMQELMLEISRLTGVVDTMGARLGALDRTVGNIDTAWRKGEKS